MTAMRGRLRRRIFAGPSWLPTCWGKGLTAIAGATHRGGA